MEELRSLREELIDRVERLHAEKHKLEDRVAQAEQHAQVGDGEGGEERRGDRGVGEGRGGREGRERAGMLCMCIMLVHWSV